MVRLVLCLVALMLPAAVFAECRVVEYDDHNEVVCEDAAAKQAAKKPLKLETTPQREFTFYSPVKSGSKIMLAGDLTPHAIASPGDLILSYRFDELKDKIYTTSSVSIVYVERTDDAAFIIRESGSGPLSLGTKETVVTFNDKKNFLLLVPFGSACSADVADAVFLKMFRLEGNQLYYRLVLPACLSKSVEQSIPD